VKALEIQDQRGVRSAVQVRFVRAVSLAAGLSLFAGCLHHKKPGL